MVELALNELVARHDFDFDFDLGQAGELCEGAAMGTYSWGRSQSSHSHCGRHGDLKLNLGSKKDSSRRSTRPANH